MEIDLMAKNAVVTGGLGLLGSAISRRMAEAGASVIKADLLKDADWVVDVSDYNSVKLMLENMGCLHVWVNAIYPENWVDHLRGFYICNCLVAEHMALGGGGVIINLASIYAHCGPIMHLYEGTSVKVPPVDYSMVKAGIIGMMRNIARRYEGKNVRCVSVSPGGVFDNQNEKFVERYKQLVPLRRMATPDDVALAVVFLASDQASYINGIDLPIDGGFLA